MADSTYVRIVTGEPGLADPCFVSYALLPLVERCIRDPNVRLIVRAQEDGSVEQQVLAYLCTKGFRNCTVYVERNSECSTYSFPTRIFESGTDLTLEFFSQECRELELNVDR